MKIGTYFGNRDHSTIMHAYRKIKKLNDCADENLDAASTKNTISKLRQQLTEQFASQINFVWKPVHSLLDNDVQKWRYQQPIEKHYFLTT